MKFGECRTLPQLSEPLSLSTGLVILLAEETFGEIDS